MTEIYRDVKFNRRFNYRDIKMQYSLIIIVRPAAIYIYSFPDTYLEF